MPAHFHFSELQWRLVSAQSWYFKRMCESFAYWKTHVRYATKFAIKGSAQTAAAAAVIAYLEGQDLALG
jgi:hypothetical protein